LIYRHSVLSFFDLKGELLNADDPLGAAWIGRSSLLQASQKEREFIGLGEKPGI